MSHLLAIAALRNKIATLQASNGPVNDFDEDDDDEGVEPNNRNRPPRSGTKRSKPSHPSKAKRARAAVVTPAIRDFVMAEQFLKAVDTHMAAGRSEARAIALAARDMPEFWTAWLRDFNAARTRAAAAKACEGRPSNAFTDRAEALIANGMPPGRAFAQAKQELPKAHRAYLDATNGHRRTVTSLR